MEKLDAEGNLFAELRAGAHEFWETELQWPEYVMHRTPSIQTKEDDPDYIESARRKTFMVMKTKYGRLFEFIDTICDELAGYVQRRVLLEQEKRAFSDLLRNYRPGQMLNFKDFAENGTINNYRLLQSEHWVSLQYTLFISIYQWLCPIAWNSKTTPIAVGDEVTVDGELTVEPVKIYVFILGYIN